MPIAALIGYSFAKSSPKNKRIMIFAFFWIFALFVHFELFAFFALFALFLQFVRSVGIFGA